MLIPSFPTQPDSQSQEPNLLEDFQPIIDSVMDHDRQWFIVNPGYDAFVRTAVPGEFGPFNSDAELTLVENFGGHVRLRSPIAPIGNVSPGFITLIGPRDTRRHLPLVHLREQ